MTAGAVVKRINGAGEELKYGSPVANLVGAADTGATTWINLLDTGTQWVSNFDDQIVLIDVIGDSPELVEERIRVAYELIETDLRALQIEQGAPETDFITARMSPASPVIESVGGSRVRAVAMTLFVGGFITAALVVFLEVLSRNPTYRRVSVSKGGKAPKLAVWGKLRGSRAESP